MKNQSIPIWFQRGIPITSSHSSQIRYSTSTILLTYIKLSKGKFATLLNLVWHFYFILISPLNFGIFAFITSNTHGIPSFTKLFGLSPNYNFLLVFWCMVFPHLHVYNSHKFSFRSTSYAFLGYNNDHLGYLCFDGETNKFFVPRHCRFWRTGHIFQMNHKYLGPLAVKRVGPNEYMVARPLVKCFRPNSFGSNYIWPDRSDPIDSGVSPQTWLNLLRLWFNVLRWWPLCGQHLRLHRCLQCRIFVRLLICRILSLLSRAIWCLMTSHRQRSCLLTFHNRQLLHLSWWLLRNLHVQPIFTMFLESIIMHCLISMSLKRSSMNQHPWTGIAISRMEECDGGGVRGSSE